VTNYQDYVKVWFTDINRFGPSWVFNSILHLYFSYLRVNNAFIGNYNVALNFVVLITFFATPVTTMLFPAFSKLDPEKTKQFLAIFPVFSKYAAIVVVPAAALVMALSQPAIGTILAIGMLRLLCIGFVVNNLSLYRFW